MSGEGRPLRVRTAHVEWVAERLGERDRAILHSVNRLRLASGSQLERLHFHDLDPSCRARIRRRVLSRLVAWRVLMTLERRIGGVRAGSSGLVYALDICGQQLVRLATDDERSARARRPITPGVALTAHTLAVSELYVSLQELSQIEGFEVIEFLTEPACWWPNGYGGQLKPDAYLCLSASTFSDSWWLEQDQGTEHLPTLTRKLRAYLDFAAHGIGPNGVVPRVLVSVPSDARCRELRRVIRRMPAPASELLHVTTTAHAPSYLLQVLRQ